MKLYYPRHSSDTFVSKRTPINDFHFTFLRVVGHRTREGRDYPVFNVLELFERSVFETCVAKVSMKAPADIDTLDEIIANTQSVVEDWTGNVQTLCRQCSEGIPHEHHDQEVESVWSNERMLGFARHPDNDIEDVLDQWQKRTGAKVISIER